MRRIAFLVGCLAEEVLAPRVLQSMGSDVLPFSYCSLGVSARLGGEVA